MLRAAALAFVLCSGGAQAVTAARAPGDVPIDGKNVYPESITSTADGTLFNGSMDGIIYRAGPRDSTATPFIRPDATNGLLAVFGVLADERAGRLWVCSVANPFAPRVAGTTAPPSSLVAFHLKTGKFIGSWPFPAPGGVCNDIAIARDGSAYAADTPGGRILKLSRNGKTLAVAAESEQLKGIDGLAFGGDGKLYVSIVSRGELLRVDLASDPARTVVTRLKLTRPLAGPDGFRPIGGNRFLLAEGTGGRIDLVTVDWDVATIRVLRDGLGSSASVTAVGSTAYTADGKINYLVDPKLRGQDPGTFKLIAVPFE